MYVVTRAIPPRWQHLNDLNTRDKNHECLRMKNNTKKRLYNKKMSGIYLFNNRFTTM